MKSMFKPWNRRTLLFRVQLDYESQPKEREVRLKFSAKPQIGDPVRVALGGAEIEGQIVEIAGSVLHVQITKKPDGRLF